MKKKLTLHEAIVVCMVRRKRFTMTTTALAKWIARWELWRRPRDGRFPKSWQLFLRANRKTYGWLFEVVGDQKAAKVTLKCDAGRSGS